MGVKLRWHNDPPSPEAVAQTERELEEIMEDGLTAPHELIFHNVFLGRTMTGPSVFVWGDPEHPGEFQCEYTDVTEWSSDGEIQ